MFRIATVRNLLKIPEYITNVHVCTAVREYIIETSCLELQLYDLYKLRILDMCYKLPNLITILHTCLYMMDMCTNSKSNF